MYKSTTFAASNYRPESYRLIVPAPAADVTTNGVAYSGPTFYSLHMKSIRLIFTALTILLSLHTASAQYALGNTGLLNAPSADMQETGTFMAGINYMPDGMSPFNFNTANYFVNMTMLSCLELSYRCTLLKTTRYDGHRGYYQQDRSMSARLRLWREKEQHWMPSLLVGVNDPFKDEGTNYYASVYGVATKSFSLLQGDRLAISAGYYIPLNHHTLQDGPICGFSYSPAFCREAALLAEYDSKGFNLGASARLWRHLSLYLFTREGKSVAGGIRYEYTLLH